MDIWMCISAVVVTFFVGIVVGVFIEAEIDYLRNKEEELKELEARIAEMQGENPAEPFDE